MGKKDQMKGVVQVQQLKCWNSIIVWLHIAILAPLHKDPNMVGALRLSASPTYFVLLSRGAQQVQAITANNNRELGSAKHRSTEARWK